MKSLNILRAGCAITAVLFTSYAYADNQWVRAESENFIIYSNIKPQAAQAYAVNLEKYRYTIGAFYRHADEENTPKFTLYFVSKPKDLEQVWPKIPDTVLGFVRFCANGTAGYSLYNGDKISTARKIKSQEENFSQIVFFHEYAHLFFFQHSRTAYPLWFTEGFAEYYATTRIQDNQAIVGMAWSGRAYTLFREGSLKYEDILRDSPTLRDSRWQEDLYAQSWLLTHWILSDAKRTQNFGHYITARNKGEDPVKAFETTFGVPVNRLNGVLKTYLNTLQATLYNIKDMPAPEVKLTRLPESADKLLLWDSAVKSCSPKPLEADILVKIRTEAAKYPNDDYAKGVLARAEIVHGDEEKALDYYKAYTASHPDDPEGFFRLGQTLFLMALHDKFLPGDTLTSQMKKARSAFGKAYKLDPLNAANLYHLSMTAPIGPDGPDDTSLNAAYEAHLLAPSITEYAMQVARMLISKNRLTEARNTLSPLANNPHGGNFALWVGNIIAGIDAGKTQDEVLTLMNTTVTNDKTSGEPEKASEKHASNP